MTDEIRKQVIDNMVDRLARKLDEYHESTKQDHIFEIKKKLRSEIKELEERITELKLQSVKDN